MGPVELSGGDDAFGGDMMRLAVYASVAVSEGGDDELGQRLTLRECIMTL